MAGLRQAQEFDWSKTAAATLAVYAEAVALGPGFPEPGWGTVPVFAIRP